MLVILSNHTDLFQAFNPKLRRRGFYASIYESVEIRRGAAKMIYNGNHGLAYVLLCILHHPINYKKKIKIGIDIVHCFFIYIHKDAIVALIKGRFSLGFSKKKKRKWGPQTLNSIQGELSPV